MDIELVELRNANHAADKQGAEMSADECHECCAHRDACERMWWLLEQREVNARQMGCKSCLEWEER